MKFKFPLNEKSGYHYGNLDVAKRADRREIMGGRGTGHFGTGFYMVGTFDPDNAHGYGQRACWEVDLDKYNLFKPKSNSEAYKLHDALKEINKGKPTEFPTLDFFEQMIIYPIYDKYYDCDTDDIASFFNVSYKDALDLQFSGEYKTKTNSEGKYMFPPEDNEKFVSELEQELDDIGILYYLNNEIDVNRLGQLEQDIKEVLEWQDSRRRHLRWAIDTLNKIFGKDVAREVEKALDSEDKEDSRSTVFMKELGYEGIDVTHLNKDGEGLSGLDNFAYGSVIYDLKPNTYKKIKEKDSKEGK